MKTFSRSRVEHTLISSQSEPLTDAVLDEARQRSWQQLMNQEVLQQQSKRFIPLSFAYGAMVVVLTVALATTTYQYFFLASAQQRLAAGVQALERGYEALAWAQSPASSDFYQPTQTTSTEATTPVPTLSVSEKKKLEDILNASPQFRGVVGSAAGNVVMGMRKKLVRSSFNFWHWLIPVAHASDWYPVAYTITTNGSGATVQSVIHEIELYTGVVREVHRGEMGRWYNDLNFIQATQVLSFIVQDSSLVPGSTDTYAFGTPKQYQYALDSEQLTLVSTITSRGMYSISPDGSRRALIQPLRDESKLGDYFAREFAGVEVVVTSVGTGTEARYTLPREELFGAALPEFPTISIEQVYNHLARRVSWSASGTSFVFDVTLGGTGSGDQAGTVSGGTTEISRPVLVDIASGTISLIPAAINFSEYALVNTVLLEDGGYMAELFPRDYDIHRRLRQDNPNTRASWFIRLSADGTLLQNFVSVVGASGINDYLVTPDGSTIVFTRQLPTHTQLWVIAADSATPTHFSSLPKINFRLAGWSGDKNNILIWDSYNKFYNVHLPDQSFMQITP